MVTPVAVECLRDYKLLITFSNGEKKIYNAEDGLTIKRVLPTT